MAPAFLRQRLTRWCRSWLTTKIVEDCVHVCKYKAGASANGAQARATRWAKLRESNLLALYKLSSIVLTQQDKAKGVKFDMKADTIYDAEFLHFQ